MRWSDAFIGEGFDAAIRIAALPNSSLIARRLCEMPRYLVGAPAYLNKHGRPKHPLHLAEHRCIGYSYTMTADTWRFTKNGKSATVRPSGPLRVNNGDAMLPVLIADGLGPARIHLAGRPRRRPTGAIAAGLVAAIGRGLLGYAGPAAATEAGRGSRRLPIREAVPTHEARSESGAPDWVTQQIQAAMTVEAARCLLRQRDRFLIMGHRRLRRSILVRSINNKMWRSTRNYFVRIDVHCPVVP